MRVAGFIGLLLASCSANVDSPADGGGAPSEGDGLCETISFEVPDGGPVDVSLDATHVYWATRDGRVFRGSIIPMAVSDRVRG